MSQASLDPQRLWDSLSAKRRGSPLGVLCRSWCLALAVTALGSLGAGAQSTTAAFEAANRLYEQGKFGEAAAAYEQMLQGGRASAALYFNLGNAFFKAGQIGRAVVTYRQAAQLTPRDSDLRANLQFARNQIQGPTLSQPWWQRWLGEWSLTEWTMSATVAVWVWLLLLAVLQWRPSLRPVLRNYVTALGAGAALLCCLFTAALVQNRFIQTAIVVTHDAVARQGPLDESPTAFTAHDGAELRLLDRKDEWLQVSADPRHSGWLRRDQVLVVPGT